MTVSSPVTTSAEAFAMLRPQFAAVPDDAVLLINADMNAVGTRLLAYSGKIASLVPQAHATFKDFDDTAFKQVALCAMALLQAHSLHKTSTVPAVDPRPGLAEVATPLRTRLIDGTQYLVRQGLIDAEQVASIKGLNGYRFLASDLMGLSNVLRQRWGTVAGKSAVTEGDIDQAASLADALFVAVAEHEKNERAVAEATLLRQKAYTFVFHRYEGIRRVVSFLRWEQGDADDFAPSLFAGRGGRPRKASEEDKAPDDADQATPAGGPTPAGPPVTPVADGQPGGSPFLDARPVPPGHQGGSPFLR